MKGQDRPGDTAVRVTAGRIGLVAVVTAQLRSAHTVVLDKLGVDAISADVGAPRTCEPCTGRVPAGGHLADIGALKVVRW